MKKSIFVLSFLMICSSAMAGEHGAHLVDPAKLVPATDPQFAEANLKADSLITCFAEDSQGTQFSEAENHSELSQDLSYNDCEVHLAKFYPHSLPYHCRYLGCLPLN